MITSFPDQDSTGQVFTDPDPGKINISDFGGSGSATTTKIISSEVLWILMFLMGFVSDIKSYL